MKTRICYLLFLGLVCCTGTKEITEEKKFEITFEKFTLDNGLEVIFHVDRSDPVVAVELTSHVGSAREKPGRTGFAHLFEHLLFLESENLGKGGLDKLSARIGGSGANGSTSRDRTSYYQTVPNDALEKMLWAEADKLGFFINTVNEQVLAKEKQVVKNEKRQSVDNRPYGHTSYVIDKNLYPEDHPYNWQVIGSLEDLQNATLEDVKEFFRRWYVPNNVTLSVAGDFDTKQAKIWVEKYFGEIKRGEAIPPMEKRPAILTETKKLYHEDNFANLPEITIAWPGVPLYHPDAHALDILTSYLANGKTAPLYKKLVEKKQLTSTVNFYNENTEIAGELILSVRGFENTDLDSAHQAIHETFTLFEKDGISETDLNRIKAGLEIAFYNSMSSVFYKAFYLTMYNIFTDDPSSINQHIPLLKAVTREDVMNVYTKYIKDKNYVVTSFVPKGKLELALENSTKADVVEEQIVQGAEAEFDATAEATYTRTPSSFDRTKEPEYGNTPEVKTPDIWRDSLANGLKVMGIYNDEIPMTTFSLRIRSGLYLDDPRKPGVANLLAELFTKGTAHKTPEELETAMQLLGADITATASNEHITISGTTLSRNYEKTLALLTEMLLEPRWDEKELLLAKQRVISSIQDQKANPSRLGNVLFKKILYGKDHILANDVPGTEQSVASITMADIRAYYEQKLSPSQSAFLVVGDVTKETTTNSLTGLTKGWKQIEVAWPVYKLPTPPEKSKVLFYDVPGAKQSTLRFGYPALLATDKDYYPADVMNFILGGGGFASQLLQKLREEKGYTYGIVSSFTGSSTSGHFIISSGVRSNVTLEAAQLVKEVLENYGSNFNENDLAVTKSSLIKSNARAFETPYAKLEILSNISDFGWPHDYVKQREQIVDRMSVEQIKALADQYVRPDKMYYLVVGDAKTQMKRLSQLGFGEPVLIKAPASEPLTLK